MEAVAHFVVPSGPCQGRYDSVVVSTDLEPDDAIALYALAPRLRGVSLLVIVGEGNLDKRTMAAEMLATFGLDHCAVIVQGQQSCASLPAAATSSYRNTKQTEHEAKILELCDKDQVRKILGQFLEASANPFALLLKPPHEFLCLPFELISHTVAALYGSFNLREFISCQQSSDPSLTFRVAQSRQNAILSAFKRLLWVDRASSVGRDCVLTTETAPNVWHVIDSQPNMKMHIITWGNDIIRTFSQKVSTLEKTICMILDRGEDTKSNGLDAGNASAVVDVLEKADKKIQIMLSIARTQGCQACHADTLVCACLMDDDNRLTRFIQPCIPGSNCNFEVIENNTATSSIAALVATKRERPRIIAESLRILAVALSVAKSQNHKL